MYLSSYLVYAVDRRSILLLFTFGLSSSVACVNSCVNVYVCIRACICAHACVTVECVTVGLFCNLSEEKASYGLSDKDREGGEYDDDDDDDVNSSSF